MYYVGLRASLLLAFRYSNQYLYPSELWAIVLSDLRLNGLTFQPASIGLNY